MRTAEFVTPKHPDKMCDQISDAILDFALSIDPNARVAIEVVGGHGTVYVTGELSIHDPLNRTFLFSESIGEIVGRITGRDDLEVIVNIAQQSSEIASGVDTGGAGDQGIMRGYAVSDTPEFMPLEYVLARELCRRLYALFPVDGKTQVTLNGKTLNNVVASFQGVTTAILTNAIYDVLLRWSFEFGVTVGPDVVVFANPAGDWNLGGFDADTGLTGRKLVVDNYGPRFALGGGAFSGKDATKVDRSAAYMARLIAVKLLQEYKGDLAEVELAYAIGIGVPVEITAKVDGKDVSVQSLQGFELSPKGMIEQLGLREPIFEKTARWGHFGNGFTWK